MNVQQVVTRWDAEERAVRARLRDADAAPQEQIAGRTGMEMFEAIFAGELPPAPIGDTLDFVPIHVEPGAAVFQGRPQRRHYNPLGTVHGGWFATLLDSAVGCAVHSTLPAGKAFTTLELKINMVRPLNDRVPLVRAEGKVIHAGRQVATAEGRIVGPDGKLYAHATTTCLIFDHPATARESSHGQA
ncbi:PaaI family thioesterase [Steroidobacter flavus]|uniref:PaaI family thioesterase n=1 Tax=Steroidobacter flavus TaxID=1842136 RepID=A0ABV8SYM0_9GAMM